MDPAEPKESPQASIFNKISGRRPPKPPCYITASYSYNLQVKMVLDSISLLENGDSGLSST